MRTLTRTRTMTSSNPRGLDVEELPHVPTIVPCFLAACERYWTSMAESRLSTPELTLRLAAIEKLSSRYWRTKFRGAAPPTLCIHHS
jgi:hypothetical protein